MSDTGLGNNTNQRGVILEYIDIVRQARVVGITPELFKQTTKLEDLSSLDLRWIDFTDEDISDFDFSKSQFGYKIVSVLSRCNPEGAKFAEAEFLPEWIKYGLDENDIFTSEHSQKTLEKLSRERKEKEDIYPCKGIFHTFA